MNADDKYLFDLTGYLVLKDVLTTEEVAQLNAGIDHHRDLMCAIDRSLSGDSPALQGTSRRKDLGGMLAWERPYCEPFRKLLVHPKVKPYLEEILGRGYRLDHGPGLIAMDAGCEVRKRILRELQALQQRAGADRHGRGLRGRAFARRRGRAPGYIGGVFL